MSNEELVIRIQDGEDRDGNLMSELWEQNKGFVYKFAHKYKGSAEFDDLIQEGFLGICNAVNHWQRDKEILFSTYVTYWIRQVMVRYIDCNSGLSISMHEKLLKFDRVISQYEKESGRNPSDSEICSLMKISKKQLETIRDLQIKSEIASLDSPIFEDDELCLVDTIPDDNEDLEENVLDKVENEELSDVLWNLVDSLPGRMPEVLHKRYQEQKSYSQIGREIGIADVSVKYNECKGIEKLKKSDGIKELESFTDDIIRNSALQGNSVNTFNRTWSSSTERIVLEEEERQDMFYRRSECF